MRLPSYTTQEPSTLVASYIRHAYGAEVIPQNVFIVGSQPEDTH